MTTLDKHADDMNWQTVGGKRRLTELPGGDKPHQVQTQAAPEPKCGYTFADGHNTNFAPSKQPGGGTGV